MHSEFGVIFTFVRGGRVDSRFCGFHVGRALRVGSSVCAAGACAAGAAAHAETVDGFEGGDGAKDYGEDYFDSGGGLLAYILHGSHCCVIGGRRRRKTYPVHINNP